LNYFGIEEEKLIEQYNLNVDNYSVRCKIANKLEPKFRLMASSILKTYFGTSLFIYDEDEVNNLVTDGVTHAIMNIHQFNSNKGAKAFSYFSTIIKRKFIDIIFKKDNTEKIAELSDDIDQPFYINNLEYNDEQYYVNDEAIVDTIRLLELKLEFVKKLENYKTIINSKIFLEVTINYLKNVDKEILSSNGLLELLKEKDFTIARMIKVCDFLNITHESLNIYSFFRQDGLKAVPDQKYLDSIGGYYFDDYTDNTKRIYMQALKQSKAKSKNDEKKNKK